MQPKSLLIGGGLCVLFLFVFASCLPKISNPKKQLSSPTKDKAQQVQSEPNLTTLKCVYSGQIDGTQGITEVDSETQEYQFNRENSTISIISKSGIQKVDASVSPDLILFRTITNKTVSTQYSLYQMIVSNYQIDRKTLEYSNWGEGKYAGKDTPFMTWKYQGSCEKIVPNLEGNKI